MDESSKPGSGPEDVPRPSGKIIPYERFLAEHRIRYGFDPLMSSNRADPEPDDDAEIADSETPHRMERALEVRRRIEEGFYRRPEVLEETMRRLIRSLGGDGPTDSEARDEK